MTFQAIGTVGWHRLSKLDMTMVVMKAMAASEAMVAGGSCESVGNNWLAQLALGRSWQWCIGWGKTSRWKGKATTVKSLSIVQCEGTASGHCGGRTTISMVGDNTTKLWHCQSPVVWRLEAASVARIGR